MIHENAPFWQGGIALKGLKHTRALHYTMFCIALILVISGVLMLAQTFTHYNELFLQRQDRQLQDMVQAADENIAITIHNLQEDFDYILQRRGFMLAESKWVESGETEDLLFRMQENLIAQHSLIKAMLAIRNGEILLSTDGVMNYYFPSGRNGELQPCFAGDGTMYLALFKSTADLQYAALIDVSAWYANLTRIIDSSNSRLLLLGSRERILLHHWLGENLVTTVEELNESNCDLQAVRLMMQSRTSGEVVSATYNITYPGDTFVHEMRMAVIPLGKSANGYFIVGITSDYDEIIRPMHASIIQLIICGGMVIAGVLLMLLQAMLLAQQSRQQDRELQALQARNAETQRLLETTQELAHHQRLETIGTLTASIAHEFNNLLTPIMGYSILTLEGLPEGSDDLADNVAEIYEASRKAKTIISRLSALSRKNTEQTLRPLALDDLILRALEVAAPAQPAHVQTVTHLDCAGRQLQGNETQLSQLLLNLILNAFHAMEKSGGTLTLSTRVHEDRICVLVEDTGMGIPEEALPHIFEPFFTTKESGQGTGLGLAIVHQVTESHHGRIQVDSTVGQGTVFTLCFPLADGEN